MRQLAAHAQKPGVRTRAYQSTLVTQILTLVVILASWLHADREFAALGLAWPRGWRLTLSIALTAGVIFFHISQLRMVRRSPSARQKAGEQIRAAGDTEAIIPRSDDEWPWFVAGCFGVGVVEEVVYRGFLLWYGQAIVGLWSSIVVTVAAFGLAHSYQGWKGVLSTGAAGAFGTAVYLVTASLAAPIVMHVAVDIIYGAMARHALGDVPPASSRTP